MLLQRYVPCKWAIWMVVVMVVLSTRFLRYAPTLVPGRVLCILSKRYRFAREGGFTLRPIYLYVIFFETYFFIINRLSLIGFPAKFVLHKDIFFPSWPKYYFDKRGGGLHRLKNLMFWLPKGKVVKNLKEIGKRSRLEPRIPIISSFEEAFKRVIGSLFIRGFWV